MKSYWREHQGKKVFIAEYSNFGTDTSALFAETSEALQIITKEPPGSMLVISNVTGTVGTPGNLEVLKNVLPISNHFIKRRAAIGVGGVRRAFLDIINKLTGKVNFQSFDTLEEALDWIVKE